MSETADRTRRDAVADAVRHLLTNCEDVERGFWARMAETTRDYEALVASEEDPDLLRAAQAMRGKVRAAVLGLNRLRDEAESALDGGAPEAVLRQRADAFLAAMQDSRDAVERAFADFDARFGDEDGAL